MIDYLFFSQFVFLFSSLLILMKRNKAGNTNFFGFWVRPDGKTIAFELFRCSSCSQRAQRLLSSGHVPVRAIFTQNDLDLWNLT